MANEDTAAKLRTLALILKLGHGLMNARDFDDAAARAVNDTRMLLNFRSASLFERSGKTFKILAQSGIPEKNPRSQLVLDQIRMLENTATDAPFEVITRENGLPEELAEDQAVYAIVNLPAPAVFSENPCRFLWLLEFTGEVPSYVENSVKIAGNSVAEALYFHQLAAGKKRFGHRKTGKILFWAAMLLLLILAMFLRVPESTTAEFTLRPQEVTAIYAPYDGLVMHCFRQDGDSVTAGEKIARFDTAVLQYRKEQAQHQLAELEAEIALEERSAFADSEKLGKVRLLAARKKVLQVSVSEAQWYLDHAVITAKVPGILILTDGRAEKLAGKAVRLGDKIAEIYGGKELIAEIPVDEKDASILQQQCTVQLFLHTAPEKAIAAEILDTAVYPDLTEQNTYCYTLRCKVPASADQLRYGMRGVARISGGKVSLGYRLFKSAVLYFRGL